MKFLEHADLISRPLSMDVAGLSALHLFVGQGNQALEVVVFSSGKPLPDGVIQRAFKERKSGRAAPVLVVVLWPGGCGVCGVVGDKPPVLIIKDIGQVERLCEKALQLPNRNASIRFLSDALPTLESPLPGIANVGLLSTHELSEGVRKRKDWPTSCERAKQLLHKSNRELIKSLGFSTRRIDNLTDVLSDGEKLSALAVLLNEDEMPELGADRFNKVSPISYALTKADKENLQWVMMVQGDRIRLYNTNNIGVGRRGRTETYVECQLSLLATKDIGYLWLLFSVDALKDGGTFAEIIEASKRFSAGLAVQLRERIYNIVVPKLALGISVGQNHLSQDKVDLELCYQAALTILFRTLFVAYAEDRDLLPYKTNGAYREHSLKQKAIELALLKQNSDANDARDHWADIVRLWTAIHDGEPEWGIPSYGGALFSNDFAVSRAGALIAGVNIPNDLFREALIGLLLVKSDDETLSPIDFRALSVREFGTIYEGLLESELSIAKQDLSIDKQGVYLPAKANERAEVAIGTVYLHNKSGARKSTGSFYTPEFAVEHLLDRTLDPALDEHLSRMVDLSDADRKEQFFDFRVADIAMGSGHFLVAAVDRIERHFALWLDQNPTPSIIRELQLLRQAALKQLGELGGTVQIDDGQILRRMIARHCIYGVDLNAITVQLARLSLWIHTFVPGLPLSLLDRNLVYGNALVGVGSLEEISGKFKETENTLFAVDAEALLGQASEPLQKLARLSDATIEDIESARQLIDAAKEKTRETEALCDLITAQPLSDEEVLRGFPFEDWERLKSSIHKSRELRLARDLLDPLHIIHFPIAFPEVFLGQNRGFNVILGNPPWEEVVVNEDKFWGRHYPGFSGLKPKEQESRKSELRQLRPDLVGELEEESSQALLMREVLHTGNYPGMGTGDPDLYKAFSWRFWFLSSESEGRIGIVMPRSALNALGSEQFRRELFQKSEVVDVITLQNSGKWVFDIDPRYTIALVAISKQKTDEPGVKLRGPFASFKAFSEGKESPTTTFKVDEIMTWNESASLPLLPTTSSADVYLQLRKSPWLALNEPGQWRARPDTELHATAQKSMMDFSDECPDGFWKVYKGASFDLWNPDKGNYNAFADPNVVLDFLQKKRVTSNKGRRDSVHGEFSAELVRDPTTLAVHQPRIAFRDISRATDSRTVRCALIPPKTFITNKGPVLLFPRGDQRDQTYLLGVLSSLCLDWYARCFVETNVNFFILNPFPIPRPNRDHPLWQQVVILAGRLACVDERFAEWADAVGVECGLLSEEDKNAKIHELDAVIAHLYGLSRSQLIHVFETFHVGWDYDARLDSTLMYFDEWETQLNG